MVEVQKIEYIDDYLNCLDKDLLCFILNRGLGDTINQVLYLESNIKFNYFILCPRRNFELVEFVLKNFIKNTSFIKKIVVYDDPVHGESELILSRIKYYSPFSLNLNELENSKQDVIQIHAYPNLWNEFINKEYIDNFNQYLNSLKSYEKIKAILFTERSDNKSFENQFWQDIIDYFNENNIEVYHNKTKSKNNIYINDIDFSGCQEVDLSISSLFEFISNSRNAILIGQRSGIFDIVKFTECTKIIFYPKEPDWLYSGCSLSNDTFSHNLYEYNYPLNDEIKQIIKFK